MRYDLNETTLEEYHGELLGYCSGMLDMLKEALNYIEGQKFPICVDIADDFREKMNSANTELERYQIFKENVESNLPVAKFVFCCLLEDFCIYMEESIDCVLKFKPQVAFTLARKPLIDDVFMFMYLLYDKEEAIDFIHKEDPSKRDLGKNKELDEQLCEECLKIIGETAEENILFLLRYSDESYSIKSICDKANHLITSRKSIKTPIGSLNNVFIDQDFVDFYTKRYCKFVSVVLYYVVQIISELLQRLFDIEINRNDIVDLKDKFMDLVDRVNKQDK